MSEIHIPQPPKSRRRVNKKYSVEPETAPPVARLQRKGSRMHGSEVAELTGLSLSTLYRKANVGLIPGATKTGGSWWFDRKAIEKWLNGTADEDALVERIKRLEDKLEDIGRRLIGG